MFERYTEPARRVIFFARYEATLFGSLVIELEHLLLGLLRESPNALKSFGAEEKVAEIRERMGKPVETQKRTPTFIDLPLSDQCRIALAYAGEETERLNTRFIGTEHILLGILRQADTHPGRVLKEAGLDAETVRDKLAVSGPLNPLDDLAPVTRKDVEQLLANVAEERLGWAKAVLEHVVRAPSIAEALQRPRSLAATLAGMWGKNTPMTEGGFSRTYVEAGWKMTETHHLLQGHSLRTIERLGVQEDGHRLSYILEVQGPDGKPHRQSWEFEIPPRSQTAGDT